MPNISTSAPPPGTHSVLFHADESLLASRVAEHLEDGLRAGGTGIVVARDKHAQLIAAALSDVVKQRVRFEQPPKDAREFERDLVPKIAGAQGPVVVYGEMIDEGDDLEELWTRAAERHSFSLLCGYHTKDAPFGSSLEGGALERDPLEIVQEATADLLRATSKRDVAEIVLHGSTRGAVWVGGELVHAVGYSNDECARMKEPPHGRDGDVISFVVDGRVLGCMRANAAHDDRGRTALEIVARAAALALDRLRMRDAEGAEKARAEEASSAREQIMKYVSQDLRNPLSAILMAAGSLLRVDGVDQRAQRVRTHAQRVQRNVERMSRLIDDLVDFSAVTNGRLHLKKADHAPDDIVRHVVDVFATTAEPRGLKLEAVLEPPLPFLTCDRDRIAQALGNIISNAIKVTGPGGVITIGASLSETEIVFSVSDTGPGIEAAEIERVFDREWRTSSPYKQAGLGLAIAKGIVEAHGGHIWATSEAGEGATFSFTIPGVVLD